MRSKIFFWLTLVGIMGKTFAQLPDYTEHIERSYKINSQTSLDITNKYGKVQIIPWESDSVRVKIDLRIRAKDKVKLKKVRNELNFEFISDPYSLIIQTQFGENSADLLKDIIDIAGSYLSTNNAVVINYTVMVPKSLSLKIFNKFGNVYLDNWDGNFTLLLSYGNLKANRINGHSDIRITLGDCDVNFIKEGQLFLSYGNLHLGSCVRLDAQTRSSVIHIDKATHLTLDSRRDKLYLGQVSKFTGSTYFSNIFLNSLMEEFVFNSRYGNISIAEVQNSFSLLSIASDFTDLNLTFEKPFSFSFDMIHHQDVVFIYPNSMASLKTSGYRTEVKLLKTTGVFGPSGSVSSVSLRLNRKCSVNILQK